MIMDFGIAMALSGTEAGRWSARSVGTSGIWRPSRRAANLRSTIDIYTFGLILYDLLIGRRRFAVATSPMSEAMARMQRAPRPIRTLEPAVPEAVERIVARCLVPDPAKRYQTVAELLLDLDRLDADGRERVAPSRPWLVPDFASSWPRWAQLALVAAVVVLATMPAVVLVAILVGGWLNPAARHQSHASPCRC